MKNMETYTREEPTLEQRLDDIVSRFPASFKLLRDQKKAIKRMYRKLQKQDSKEETLVRGMLCDMEMGVGKTIMACVLLTLLLEDLPPELSPGRCLLLVPVNMMDTWRSTLQMMNQPHLQVTTVHKLSKEQRRTRLQAIQQTGPACTIHQLIMCPPSTAKQYVDEFLPLWPSLLVFDEIHNLSNPSTKGFKSLRMLARQWEVSPASPFKGKWKPVGLGLSGTPITNDLVQLYAEAKLLCPHLFGEARDFEERFVRPINGALNSRPGTPKYEIGVHMLRRLRQHLEDYTEKLTKAEMDMEHLRGGSPTDGRPQLGLAARLCNMVVHLQPTEEQTKQARKVLEESQIEDWLENPEGPIPVEGGILALLNQLRSVGTHPWLRYSQESFETRLAAVKADETGDTWRHLLVDSSNKMQFLVRFLEERQRSFSQEVKKIAVVSEWRRVTRMVGEVLRRMNIPFLYLDGDTPLEERTQVQDLVNDPDSHIEVVLMTRRTGGEGIKLLTQVMIRMDPWWTHAADRQTFSRMYRIGQTQDVAHIQLLSSGLTEEIMFMFAMLKGQYAHLMKKSGACRRACSPRRSCACSCRCESRRS